MDTFSVNVLPVSSIAERVKLYTPFSLKPMILSTDKISPSINSETSTSSPFLVRDHTKSISSVFFVSVFKVMFLSVWVILSSSNFISPTGYILITSLTMVSFPNSSVTMAVNSYSPMLLNIIRPPVFVSSPVILVSNSISLPSL